MASADHSHDHTHLHPTSQAARAAGGSGVLPAADAASTPTDDVHARVSGRLKALRTERGLTLAEVAGAAGMDASTLSRLESGARRLTLDHLPTLARALGVRADDLLGAPPAVDPRVRTKAFKREGITFLPLHQHPTGPGGHAFKMILPASPRDREPNLRTHEGHDWLFVLSGRVRLVLGEEEFILEPGEAAEFSTWTPHWMSAIDGPAELIAIFGPHGESVHVHTVESGDDPS